MILKASKRGGARQLAKHLMNGEKNEYVTVHEVSGFASGSVGEALNEIYAISKEQNVRALCSRYHSIHLKIKRCRLKPLKKQWFSCPLRQNCRKGPFLTE